MPPPQGPGSLYAGTLAQEILRKKLEFSAYFFFFLPLPLFFLERLDLSDFPVLFLDDPFEALLGLLLLEAWLFEELSLLELFSER